MLTATNPTMFSMLRTLLLPLESQDNEELVRLLWNGDVDHLCLLGLMLDLELYLAVAEDLWTKVVTQQPYAVGSGVVSLL